MKLNTDEVLNLMQSFYCFQKEKKISNTIQNNHTKMTWAIYSIPDTLRYPMPMSFTWPHWPQVFAVQVLWKSSPES